MIYGLRFTVLVIILFIFHISLFINPMIVGAQAQSPLPKIEERAVGNLSILMPEEALVKTEEAPGVIKFFKNAVCGVAQLLGLFFQCPTSEEQTYDRSDGVQTQVIPTEVRPKEGESPGEKQKQFLGTQVGFYGVVLPEFEGQTKRDIRTDECNFESANFPKGINVVTPPGKCGALNQTGQ